MKPITVEREEFVQKIVDAVNGASLPAFVKMDVLNNCIRELSEVAKNEYRRDAESYYSEHSEESEAK